MVAGGGEKLQRTECQPQDETRQLEPCRAHIHGLVNGRFDFLLMVSY